MNQAHSLRQQRQNSKLAACWETVKLTLRFISLFPNQLMLAANSLFGQCCTKSVSFFFLQTALRGFKQRGYGLINTKISPLILSFSYYLHRHSNLFSSKTVFHKSLF